MKVVTTAASMAAMRAVTLAYTWAVCLVGKWAVPKVVLLARLKAET